MNRLHNVRCTYLVDDLGHLDRRVLRLDGGVLFDVVVQHGRGLLEDVARDDLHEHEPVEVVLSLVGAQHPGELVPVPLGLAWPPTRVAVAPAPEVEQWNLPQS